MLITDGWADDDGTSLVGPLISNIRSISGVLRGRSKQLEELLQWLGAYLQAAAIKTFQNPDRLPGCPAPPCNATHTSVTDMEPNLPGGPQINSIVNIGDVFSIILGFQGQEYPGTQIELCLDP